MHDKQRSLSEKIRLSQSTIWFHWNAYPSYVIFQFRNFDSYVYVLVYTSID